jgi:hypothetical protein
MEVFMKQFESLLEAAEYAATIAGGWCFTYSNDTYTKSTLLPLAETADNENPVDEDSFYVVSPGGAIGFCEDGEDIDWQFLPSPDTGETLPDTYAAAPQINFCPKCGNAVTPGARFCGACGARLD